MNKKDKRKFSSAFKVKVGPEALQGQSTVALVAKSYELHPSQSLDRKKTLSERSEKLFISKGKRHRPRRKITDYCMNRMGDFKWR